jgi:hypothetical protein
MTSARSRRRTSRSSFCVVASSLATSTLSDAVLDHDLGFGHLPAGHADRAHGPLVGRDPRRLVALGVRPPRLAAGMDGRDQPVDVALEPVEVEQEDRRVQLGDGAADARVVCGGVDGRGGRHRVSGSSPGSARRSSGSRRRST